MCVNGCGVVSVNVITIALKMCAFCVIVSSKKRVRSALLCLVENVCVLRYCV